ncbi:MAG: aminotransferase class V-fold PLP-dependent enzyme, partial [Duncaniella sp.]|nr:aminotransferase class V-fold PLP-dependent enzyme [Duncaniella sp.]
MYDIAKIREDFPALDREVNGRPLVYLDNTATSQTPRCVVDAVTAGYYHTKANVHRGVHTLSVEATELLEATRRSVKDFINAPSDEEIIFTRGTTEALNLVASSFGGMVLGEGDELILTDMEHHSNIVPWQLLQQRKGFTIKVVPVTPDGSLDLDALRRLISPRTRLISVCHASNVLGSVTPIAEITALANSHGMPVLVDGA